MRVCQKVVNMNEQYKVAVLNFFASRKQNTPLGTDSFWTDNYFALGYLDSLEFFQFILFLEQNLELEIDIGHIIELAPHSFEMLHSAIFGAIDV